MEGMKFRTVALALALGFGLTAVSEAKVKRPRPVHKVQNRKSKARSVKPRKFKKPTHR
jgi:hypothetical protein